MQVAKAATARSPLPPRRKPKTNAVGYKRFELGKSYRTQGGNVVTVVKVNNENRGYETVQCDDPINGDPEGGHRYNRPGDLGRVTGTNHDGSDPRNLIPEIAVDLELVSARRYAVPFADEMEVKLAIMEARAGLCVDHPAGAFAHERMEDETVFYVTVLDEEWGKLYISRGVKGRPGIPV